ncbi:hypothetical protein ACWGQ5_55705 [Streptomyces sp. NPDC055722]
MQWIPTVDTKLNIWTTAAVTGASIALYNTLRGWWRNTLGKRAFFVRNYRKLAPHVRHEYVNERRSAREGAGRCATLAVMPPVLPRGYRPG